MKKLVALLLSVLILAASVCGMAISASAEEDERPIYVALGDSVTAGFSLPGVNSLSLFTLEALNAGYSEDCYVSLVGNAMNYKTYNMAVSGLDTIGLLEILNDEDFIANPEESNFWFKKVLAYVSNALYPGEALYSYNDRFLDTETYETARALANAELITLNIGSNEVTNPMMKKITDIPGMEESGIQSLLFDALAPGLGGADETTIDLSALIEHADEILEAFSQEALYEMMDAAAAQIMADYVPIINRLEEINPNAKIVVCGFYNLYSGSMLNLNTLADSAKEVFKLVKKYLENGTESLAFADFGTLIYRAISTAMKNPMQKSYDELNVFLKELCANDSQLYFADLTGMPKKETIDPHPAEEGQAYIANSILKALSSNVMVYDNGIFGVKACVKMTGAKRVNATTWNINGGSVATLKVTAPLGYEVKSVQMNGQTLTPEEDGTYKLSATASNYKVKVNLALKKITFPRRTSATNGTKTAVQKTGVVTVAAPFTTLLARK